MHECVLMSQFWIDAHDNWFQMSHVIIIPCNRLEGEIFTDLLNGGESPRNWGGGEIGWGRNSWDTRQQIRNVSVTSYVFTS